VALPVEKDGLRFPLEETVDNPLPEETLQGLQGGDVRREAHRPAAWRLVAQVEDLVEDHPLRVGAELDPHLVDYQQIETAQSPDDLALGDLRIAREIFWELYNQTCWWYRYPGIFIGNRIRPAR